MSKSVVMSAFVVASGLLAPIAAQAAGTTQCSSPGITKADVQAMEAKWGQGIVDIGAAQDPKATAKAFVKDLYAYDAGSVLFKPTKASADEFRETPAEAQSYFVSGIVPEDHGFALAPYTKVRFENNGIVYDCNSATAMGNYYFTNTSGKEVKADFTLGFVKQSDGDIKIDVHHSSFPFSPKAKHS
ncbi:hypothetical protein [Roseibium algae]|uniref:Phosphoribosyl-AMP cyclohydrolase n=1 Tax=Roseibium algae TaxID=3123038 RepID=A0ABU8TRD0_9HYPH